MFIVQNFLVLHFLLILINFRFLIKFQFEYSRSQIFLHFLAGFSVRVVGTVYVLVIQLIREESMSKVIWLIGLREMLLCTRIVWRLVLNRIASPILTINNSAINCAIILILFHGKVRRLRLFLVIFSLVLAGRSLKCHHFQNTVSIWSLLERLSTWL